MARMSLATALHSFPPEPPPPPPTTPYPLAMHEMNSSVLNHLFVLTLNAAIKKFTFQNLRNDKILNALLTQSNN